jgi:hypothetical protein
MCTGCALQTLGGSRRHLRIRVRIAGQYGVDGQRGRAAPKPPIPASCALLPAPLMEKPVRRLAFAGLALLTTACATPSFTPTKEGPVERAAGARRGEDLR